MIDDEAKAARPADETDTTDDEGKKKKGSFWKELPILLVIAVVVALVVRSFVVQSFWIPSGSMENTLQLDDYVLANKLEYTFGEPERGEVVVFQAPMEWRSDPAEEDFIKRVIAVGGDTVSYSAEDRVITVNGYPLDETEYLYTDPYTGVQQSPSKDDEEFTVTVPEGRLWVMGDHRWASGDSRERYVRSGGDVMAATIPVENAIGRAFVLIWPLDRWDWLGIPDTFDGVPDPA
ncbi:signal peptidase I [Stackebrandtia albiflava]|uniref:signal peptidase I n=1 Tax=Stackebrandtia albiflava TaxID=406432 RepID=UPI001FCEE9BD|nr:signal peptidase I [Stackebrandtia albiflava]